MNPSSPCHRCTAQCCRQTAAEFAVLLQGEREQRRFHAWSISLALKDEHGTRCERVIPYREGMCPFLGSDDRCTIYDDRPQACRDFECVRHFNQLGPGKHGLFLQRNLTVLKMLEVE